MPDNVETAKAIYEAFGQGDAIIAGFGEVAGSWAQFSVEPSQYIDGGEWVTVRGIQRATGKAGSFECPYAHLMRFADGALARAEFYTDSAQAKAALG
jgi:ketosteroid isomerase-like protein